MDRIEIAVRFKEKRERLGFSQAAFARMLDTNREAVRKFEVGMTELKSGTLANAVKLGMDIQFVLTGVRSKNIEDVEREAGYTKQVNYGNNVVGFMTGGVLNHTTTETHVTKTIAEVKPGDEHISDQQAAALLSLVNDIVKKEDKLRDKPATHRAVWGALNSFCKVPKYRLIPASDFVRARKYLDQWMGRLNSMKSAPVKDGDAWRKRHYAYIKINSKDDLMNQSVKTYMRREFKVSSLTELSNDELERVYRYVAGKRRKRR